MKIFIFADLLLYLWIDDVYGSFGIVTLNQGGFSVLGMWHIRVTIYVYSTLWWELNSQLLGKLRIR